MSSIVPVGLQGLRTLMTIFLVHKAHVAILLTPTANASVRCQMLTAQTNHQPSVSDSQLSVTDIRPSERKNREIHRPLLLRRDGIQPHGIESCDLWGLWTLLQLYTVEPGHKRLSSMSPSVP